MTEVREVCTQNDGDQGRGGQNAWVRGLASSETGNKEMPGQ